MCRGRLILWQVRCLGVDSARCSDARRDRIVDDATLLVNRAAKLPCIALLPLGRPILPEMMATIMP